jgi:hypothetical protein
MLFTRRLDFEMNGNWKAEGAKRNDRREILNYRSGRRRRRARSVRNPFPTQKKPSEKRNERMKKKNRKIHRNSNPKRPASVVFNFFGATVPLLDSRDGMLCCAPGLCVCVCSCSSHHKKGDGCSVCFIPLPRLLECRDAAGVCVTRAKVQPRQKI